MTHASSRFLRILLSVLAYGFLAPVLGCGSGGGSANEAGFRGTSPSGGVAGGTGSAVISVNATNPAPPSDGCGVDAFSPNFAALIHPLFHWSHFPVKVFFATDVVITTDNGDKIDLRGIALGGFQEWADSSAGTVTIVETKDPRSADITVHLRLLPGLPTASDILGIEQSTLDSKGAIQHADIKLNTWPGMSQENVSSFQETSAHEFGHALGINGHSDDPADVMYASHSLYVSKEISKRDVNTLKNAYCGQTGKSAGTPAVGGTRTVTID